MKQSRDLNLSLMSQAMHYLLLSHPLTGHENIETETEV